MRRIESPIRRPILVEVKIFVEQIESAVRFDATFVFGQPFAVIGRPERLREVDADRDLKRAMRTDAVLQPGVGSVVACDDPHYRPVERAEHAGECRLVHKARQRRVSRMRVQPDPRETVRRQTRVDLLVKEVGHSHVVEGDRRGRTSLPKKLDVFHQQGIGGCGNPESADLGLADVTQV